MRKILFLFLFTILFSVASAQPKSKFLNTEFDFGEIKVGATVDTKFRVVNLGTSPLIIKDVRKSCGCTDPIWPKYPIMPKDTVTIHVGFDSKEYGGRPIKKSVIVTTNQSSAPSQILYIKGKVLKN